MTLRINLLARAYFIGMAFASAGWLGCSTPAPSPKHPDPPPSPQAAQKAGVRFHLTEKAFDGEHVIKPGSPITVDAHSTLVLSFDNPPTVDDAVEGDPEWRALNELLRWLLARSEEYQELAAREVDLSNPEQVKLLQNDSARLANVALALVRDPPAGLNQDKIRDIALDPAYADGYQALAAWADAQLDRIRQDTERDLTNRVQSVTVQATHDTTTGKRSVLHIDEWDTMEQGAYDPIDRTGLSQNEGEAERLASREKEAQATVNVVRTLQDKEKLKGLQDDIKKKLRQVEEAFKLVVGHYEDAPVGWAGNELEGLIGKLRNIASTNGTPAVTNAAMAVMENVTAIRSSVAQIEEVVRSAERIEVVFTASENLSALDLLNSFTGNLDQAIDEVVKLAVGTPKTLNAIAMLSTNLPALGQALTAEEKQALLPEPVRSFFESLPELPEEAQALLALWEAVKRFPTPAKVAGEFDAPEEYLISRPTDDLVDARLNLQYGGLALGDLVSIRVRVEEIVPGSPNPRLVDSEIYQGKVGFIGLHGKPAVHAFFARGLSGDDEAKEWKPNVAAGVEWHYTIRDPQNKWEKAWNWVDPGAGFHLANLDQGEENIEIGSGGTVSFLDGLLAAGLGYNFSTSEEYVFVGVNLISALQQAKGRFGK